MNLGAFAEKAACAEKRSAKIVECLRLGFLGQLYQMPTTTLGTTLAIVHTTILLNNISQRCYSNR